MIEMFSKDVSTFLLQYILIFGGNNRLVRKQMTYKKANRTILNALIFLSLMLVLFQPMDKAEQISVATNDYTPERLFLTVYADGKVDVEYVAFVDSSLASVEIPLLGVLYENLLVVNEGGLPLDYSILDGKVVVYTLGSWKLEFSYTTPDLTSKVGRVWALRITSPIEFMVKLPADATIVALSTAPTSIGVVDGHHFLTMPAGEQEISYIVGVIGSKERALALINEAEEVIGEAKVKGADVTQAEAKLKDAKTALEEERYAEAELLAAEAKRMAEEALAKIVAFPVDPLWIVVGVVAGGLVAAFVLFRLRRKAPPPKLEREFRRIDVHRVLERAKHLRLEDREAIEFIALAGGEVFEAELREKFKLPKSTVWRMVKRLKREGFVEVVKVGGQNLVRLIEQ
jgi:uncharacterized membrane protein